MLVKTSELKHKITVYKKDIIINGDYGTGSGTTYIPVKEVYAKKMYHKYAEKIKTLGTIMENSLTFVIRADSDFAGINSKWKISHEGTDYNIIQSEYSYDENFILLTCKE